MIRDLVFRALTALFVPWGWFIDRERSTHDWSRPDPSDTGGAA